MNRLKGKRASRQQMNTRFVSEAKSVLESDNIGSIASLVERLEANNTELDKLNELIEV